MTITYDFHQIMAIPFNFYISLKNFTILFFHIHLNHYHTLIMI